MTTIIEIPPQLSERLALDPELLGVTMIAVSRFGTVFESSGTPFFRAYTNHGPKHVAEVLETSFRLISARAWDVFSPKDSALLILSVLLHDSALHLQEAGFLKLLGDARFRIPEFDSAAWLQLWDDFRAAASRFDRHQLRELFGVDEPIEPPELRRTEKWTEVQYDYIGEFLRRHHARLAHEIARFGFPGPSDDVIGLTGANSYLADLTGLLARSHGLPLRSCLPYLEKNYHLQDFQGAHVVFVMTLLRISDYLQIQAGRAPQDLLRVKELRSPLARREWSVHDAVPNVAFNNPDPEAVRLQIDPTKTNLKSFLRIREWQAGIQQELDTSWAVLGEVYGRYAAEGLDKLGLTIRRVYSDLDEASAFAQKVPFVPEKIELSTAQADLLQLLIRPLYGDHPEVGVRELIQNAVDAVLECESYCARHGIDRKSVEFPEMRYDVIVEYFSDPSLFRITDKGIGMTVGTVRDYFLKAGASFRSSDFWKSEYEDDLGNAKINRSGRFGVGLLASFLLGNEVKVTTRHVTDSAGVSFKVSLDNTALELTRVNCPVGTCIEIALRPQTAPNLTPAATEWYFLHKPSVVQMRHNKGTTTRHCPKRTLPSCNAALPAEWRRLKTRQFLDFQWSFADVPGVVCNGIEVRSLDGKGGFGMFSQSFFSSFDSPIANVFRYPSISVFDPNGNLPITLARDYVPLKSLPLNNALEVEVIADFIAYCLVVAPHRHLLLRGRPPVKPEFTYPGFPKSGISLPYWVQTPTGSILADAVLLWMSGVRSLFLPQMADRVPPWVTQVKPARVPLRYGFSQNSRSYFIRSVLYHGKHSRASSGLTPISFTGGRYLLRRDYAESWNQYGNLRASMRKQINQIWQNKDFVKWEIGDCGVGQVNLKAIAKTIKKPQEYGFVCAEKFVARPPGDAFDRPLVQAWRAIIGDRAIPFNSVQRDKIVENASGNIRAYVRRWRQYLAAKPKKAD